MTSTSAQSGAIGTANLGDPKMRIVCRLVSDIDCWITFGTNPTAAIGATNSILLPASSVEYFDVPAGNKIGAICATTGNLSIAQMAKP